MDKKIKEKIMDELSIQSNLFEKSLLKKRIEKLEEDNLFCKRMLYGLIYLVHEMDDEFADDDLHKSYIGAKSILAEKIKKKRLAQEYEK